MMPDEFPPERKVGRPPTLTMPESIPDTLDNVMDAVLSTPPKKRSEWKYLRDHKEAANRTPLDHP